METVSTAVIKASQSLFASSTVSESVIEAGREGEEETRAMEKRVVSAPKTAPELMERVREGEEK